MEESLCASFSNPNLTRKKCIEMIERKNLSWLQGCQLWRYFWAMCIQCFGSSRFHKFSQFGILTVFFYLVANTEVSFLFLMSNLWLFLWLHYSWIMLALDSSTEFEEKLIPLNVITKCTMVDEKELFRKNAAYFL